MNDTLAISLQKLGLGRFQTLFEDLQAAQDKFEVTFCVIGATARDIWFRARTDHISYRLTNDLDVTVSLESMTQWEAVRDYLLKKKGYQQKTNPIKLFKQSNHGPDILELDILPIGAIEDDNREVPLPGKGGELQVLGMQEVFDAAFLFTIEEGFQGRIASMAQICLLKLVSYSFQPEWRSHDPNDVAEIAKFYWELENHLVYEQYNELLEVYEVKASDYTLQVGAHALGCEIMNLASSDSYLLDRITSIATSISNKNQQSSIWQALISGLKQE